MVEIMDLDPRGVLGNTLTIFKVNVQVHYEREWFVTNNTLAT